MTVQPDTNTQQQDERLIRRALGTLYMTKDVCTPEEAAVTAPIAEQEAEEAVKALDRILRELGRLVARCEEAERVYRMLKATEAMELKDARARAVRAERREKQLEDALHLACAELQDLYAGFTDNRRLDYEPPDPSDVEHVAATFIARAALAASGPDTPEVTE